MTPPWGDVDKPCTGGANENTHGDSNEDEGRTRSADPESSDCVDSSEIGVYLGDMARRVFLNQFFRRLRERMFYPPRQAAFELRDIFREQIYHLARVLEGEEERYIPFVPE